MYTNIISNILLLLVIVTFVSQLFRTRKRLIRVYGKLDRLLKATTVDHIDFLRSPRILKLFNVDEILKHMEKRIDQALAEQEVAGDASSLREG